MQATTCPQGTIAQSNAFSKQILQESSSFSAGFGVLFGCAEMRELFAGGEFESSKSDKDKGLLFWF